MRIFSLFEKPIKITEKNYQEKEIIDILEKLHQTHLTDDRENTWKDEEKRHLKNVEGLKSLKNWEKLTGITDGLGAGSYGNLFPDYLLKLYAPFFFECFEKGEIWFLPFNEDASIQFSIEQSILNRRYNPSDHPFGYSQSFGVDFESTLGTIGLEIPMFVRFPYLQGSMTGSMRGICCFIIKEPISIYKDNVILHEKLMDKTKYFYSDSLWEGGNPRYIFPPMKFDEFKEYFDWYIEALNNLYNFVLNLPDIESKRLVSFSIARSCLDTYLIQILEQPYLRKNLFFTLLDKYAGLVHEFRTGVRGDVDIWNKLLSFNFFENNLESITNNTPSALRLSGFIGDHLRDIVNHLLTSKYSDWDKRKLHEDEAIEILRTYRNTHHGYLLYDDQRTTILQHDGDIPNYLPDYSLDLWHIFLADPKKFIKVLK